MTALPVQGMFATITLTVRIWDWGKTPRHRGQGPSKDAALGFCPFHVLAVCTIATIWPHSLASPFCLCPDWLRRSPSRFRGPMYEKRTVRLAPPLWNTSEPEREHGTSSLFLQFNEFPTLQFWWTTLLHTVVCADLTFPSPLSKHGPAWNIAHKQAADCKHYGESEGHP